MPASLPAGCRNISLQAQSFCMVPSIQQAHRECRSAHNSFLLVVTTVPSNQASPSPRAGRSALPVLLNWGTQGPGECRQYPKQICCLQSPL